MRILIILLILGISLLSSCSKNSGNTPDTIKIGNDTIVKLTKEDLEVKNAISEKIQKSLGSKVEQYEISKDDLELLVSEKFLDEDELKSVLIAQ